MLPPPCRWERVPGGVWKGLCGALQQEGGQQFQARVWEGGQVAMGVPGARLQEAWVTSPVQELLQAPQSGGRHAHDF